MSIYDPLKDFLENTHTTTVVLSFEDVEQIIRYSLPASASKYQAWWANDTKHHVHAKAWLNAGWLVESPTAAVRTHNVTFIKKTSERTYHKKPHSEQNRQTDLKKSYNTPQEFFAYFNCAFPPQDNNQLKNSYLGMIKKYHPDRVAGMGEEIIETAERKTKEINDMYEKALAYFKR